MRNAKAGFVDHLVACQDEIEVECPWRIRSRPGAAVPLFDVEKRLEQLAGRAGRSADTRGIEIGRIVFQSGADRRGFDQE